MPRFLDIHSQFPEMPPEVAEMAVTRLKQGVTDEHGVRGIDVLVADDGSGYCLSEGPSKDAVIASHEALGLKLVDHDVKEVKSLITG